MMISRGSSAGKGGVVVPVTGTAKLKVPKTDTTKVALTVLKRYGDNRVLLKYPGGKLTIRLPKSLFNLPLNPGTQLSGRFTKDSAGKLTLTFNLPLQSGYSAMLERAGIPQDGLTSIILKVFYRSGIPVSPNLIKQCRAQLSDAGKDLKKARLFSLLHEKGIIPDDKIISILSEIVGEKNDSTDSRGKKESSPEKQKEITEIPLSSFLDELKKIISRKTSGNHPIQLFNHLYKKKGEGNHNHWIMIPFSMNTPVGKCDGKITMLLDIKRSMVKKSSIEAGFNGEDRWGFDITLGGGKKNISVIPPNNNNNKRQNVKNIKSMFLDCLTKDTFFPGKIDPDIDDIIIKETEETFFDGFPDILELTDISGINTAV
jgi:hypothetical protein